MEISAKANVGGSLGWEGGPDGKWKTSAAKTGINGFVGFELAGKATVEGQFLEVKFGGGGEFKTTDDTGGRQSGIDINYKPTMFNNQFHQVDSWKVFGINIMYQENEDDWKILKEYKQNRRNTLSNDRERANKVEKRAKLNRPKVEKELQSETRRQKIKDKQELLEAPDHDIKKAGELEAKYTAETNQLKADIEEIDKRIKELRRKQNEAKSTAAQQKAEPVQKCPKKCRIRNVKITCGHKKLNLDAPPFEKEVPRLNVLTSGGAGPQDIVDISFGGNCDHGKRQSAGDSDKHKIKKRKQGAEQYCPRVQVVNPEDGTDIDRPSKTRFLTQANEIPNGSNPIAFLLNRLIFGKNGLDDDAQEYDITFVSCQGSLPYKATVFAYPPCSWNLEFSFGYKSTIDEIVVEREFGTKGKVKTFDGMKQSGKWMTTLKANFAYDTWTEEIKTELDLSNLMGELGKSWSLLQKIGDFFSPVNGMIESAIGYNEQAEKAFDNKVSKAEKKDKVISKRKVSTVDIDWTQLKISGNYQRAETLGHKGIGAEGSLKLEFAPLFGITGKMDLVQMLLISLSGAFGKFLREVASMSIGYKDAKGKIDKDRAYVETNIELWFGATTQVAGSIGYKSSAKEWPSADHGCGIEGFVGLILEGKAKAEGKVWVVKVGVGAEFKTTDESGAKPPGIEISYKPVVLNGDMSWAGEMIFNGLAIVWALYANIGGDTGAQEEDGNKKVKHGGMGTQKTSAEKNVKKTKKHVLMSKRTLFGDNEPKKIGN